MQISVQEGWNEGTSCLLNHACTHISNAGWIQHGHPFTLILGRTFAAAMAACARCTAVSAPKVSSMICMSCREVSGDRAGCTEQVHCIQEATCPAASMLAGDGNFPFLGRCRCHSPSVCDVRQAQTDTIQSQWGDRAQASHIWRLDAGGISDRHYSGRWLSQRGLHRKQFLLDLAIATMNCHSHMSGIVTSSLDTEHTAASRCTCLNHDGLSDICDQGSGGQLIPSPNDTPTQKWQVAAGTEGTAVRHDTQACHQGCCTQPTAYMIGIPSSAPWYKHTCKRPQYRKGSNQAELGVSVWEARRLVIASLSGTECRQSSSPHKPQSLTLSMDLGTPTTQQ